MTKIIIMIVMIVIVIIFITNIIIIITVIINMIIIAIIKKIYIQSVYVEGICNMHNHFTDDYRSFSNLFFHFFSIINSFRYILLN